MRMANQMNRWVFGSVMRRRVNAKEVLLHADAVMEKVDETFCSKVVAVILSRSRSHRCFPNPWAALAVVAAVEMTRVIWMYQKVSTQSVIAI